MTSPQIQPTLENLRTVAIKSLNTANDNMADAVTEGANGQGENARVRIEAATAQALMSIAASLLCISVAVEQPRS
jgi:hypothetical protein